MPDNDVTASASDVRQSRSARVRQRHRASRRFGGFALLLFLLVAGLSQIVTAGAQVPTTEPSLVVGVAPNPTGTTVIDRNTEWSGDFAAGGDVLIGSRTTAITVRWHDGSVRVNGKVQVDNLALGFKPVTFIVERFRITLGLTTSEILLDHSDPAVSGSNTGSVIQIRANSTIDSVFTNAMDFPGGLTLRSGKGTYNKARLQVEDTTFRNVGNYWGLNRAAVHTRLSSSPPLYSLFTTDSYLRRLTFIHPSEYMKVDDPDANGVAVMIGDSLPIQDSEFNGGFMSTGFTKYIRNNVFIDSCRTVYDPFQDAVIQNNTIFGKLCKTVDLFHRGVFINNTVYDSVVGAQNNAPDSYAIGSKFIGNTFIRGTGPGGSADDLEYRENIIRFAPTETYQAIHAVGNRPKIIENIIEDARRTAIYVHPYTTGRILADPQIIGNTIVRFYSSSDAHKGLWIQFVSGARTEHNSISKGYLGLLVESVSNSAFEGNVVTDSTIALRIRSSSGLVFRNDTFTGSSAGIALAGGNTNLKFVGVTYSSLSFVDDLDAFRYFDYLDLFLPQTNATPVKIRNALGTTVYDSSVSGGSLRNLELQLFEQTRSTRRDYGPFTVEVSGLRPGWAYSILRNGVSLDSILADATGVLRFGADMTRKITYTILEDAAQVDVITPAVVDDLVAQRQGSSWNLAWTAPGDDDDVGRAYTYDVRFSKTGPVTGSSWGSASIYPQAWDPLSAGSTEERVLSGIDPSSDYWFAIRAADEALNWGNVSNSARILREADVQNLVSLRIAPGVIVTRADADVKLAAVASDSSGATTIVGATWTVDNGTITQTGVLRPWAVGYWNVCASYGNVSTCTILTVIPGRIATVRVYPSPLSLRPGDSALLTVGSYDSKGNIIPQVSLAWEVEPANLGEISLTNVFTARAVGRGVLRLTANDSVNTVSQAVEVTVGSGTGSGLGILEGLVADPLFVTFVTAAFFTVSLASTVALGRKTARLSRLESGQADEEDEDTGEIAYECPLCTALVERSDASCRQCGVPFAS